MVPRGPRGSARHDPVKCRFAYVASHHAYNCSASVVSEYKDKYMYMYYYVVCCFGTYMYVMPEVCFLMRGQHRGGVESSLAAMLQSEWSIF